MHDIGLDARKQNCFLKQTQTKFATMIQSSSDNDQSIIQDKEDCNMIHSVNEPRNFRAMMIALIFTIALPLFIATDIILAKGSGDNDNRSEFYGIVEERPEKRLQGDWVIGRLAFTADAGTEFDQSDGQLTIGSCAKVHVRNGRVHEIDSEPMRNCQ